MKAVVSYTDPPITDGDSKDSNQRKFTKVQVRVDSKVRDVEHGSKKPTGAFHYTFLIDRDVQVMPQSYNDYMIWVDARRRAQNTNASLLEGIIKGNSYDGLHEGATE